MPVNIGKLLKAKDGDKKANLFNALNLFSNSVFSKISKFHRTESGNPSYIPYYHSHAFMKVGIGWAIANLYGQSVAGPKQSTKTGLHWYSLNHKTACFSYQ